MRTGTKMKSIILEKELWIPYWMVVQRDGIRASIIRMYIAASRIAMISKAMAVFTIFWLNGCPST